jgi:hypothetical protein
MYDKDHRLQQRCAKTYVLSVASVQAARLRVLAVGTMMPSLRDRTVEWHLQFPCNGLAERILPDLLTAASDEPWEAHSRRL